MRSHQAPSKIPQVNLVPMIDVLMSVLTFFVIMAMNMNGMLVPDVTLPTLEDTQDSLASEDEQRPELPVGLNVNGEIVLDTTVVDLATLETEMRTFLETEPEGVIKVRADRGLKYEQIDTLLIQLAEIGGDRVLLVVQ
ncbi:MAG: ExbD/TolR family protein [Geitlerinemataceae cyanobacterium]